MRGEEGMGAEREREISGPERIWPWLLFRVWGAGGRRGAAGEPGFQTSLLQRTGVIIIVIYGALNEGLGEGVRCGLHDFLLLTLPIFL